MMLEKRYFGPPGTGKTYKIINEILPEMISKYGEKGVIVISYTRAAAAEIITRMGGKIQTFNESSTGTGNDNDDLEIVGLRSNMKIKAGTLHACCFHYLNSPEIATGKDCMKLFCEQYKFGATMLANNRLERIAYLRNKLVSIESLDTCATKTLWRMWEEFKTRNKLMDFTDLIEKCLEFPIPPGGVSAIIMDEAQDATPLQFKLLRSWNRHMKELLIIGDDDQMIYGFVGSDASELIRKDLENTEIITTVLTHSRRLPNEIHKYAIKYIEKVKIREEKNFLSNGKNGVVKNIGSAIDSDKTIKLIIEEAKDKNVMIVASCDYMLDGLIDKLKKKGVPFGNKYKLEDNRWNPVDAKTNKILNSVCECKTREDVCNWIKFIKPGSRVGCGNSGSGGSGINDVQRLAFYRPYLKEKLIETEFDKFEEACDTGDIGYKLAWFTRNLDTKYLKRFEYAIKVLNGKYSDLKEIVIGSIHSVKGRESQVVIICPEKSPAMEKDSMFDKSSLIRQFYVAMTRASEKLYFCTPVKAGIRF